MYANENSHLPWYERRSSPQVYTKDALSFYIICLLDESTQTE